MDSFMDSQLTFDQGSDKRPTSFLFGPKLLASHMYQLSPPEVCMQDRRFFMIIFFPEKYIVIIFLMFTVYLLIYPNTGGILL